MVAALGRQPLRVRIVERQRVERQVVRRQLEGRLERRHPGVERPAGHVVQQVEADRRRSRPRARPRRRRPRRAARCRRPSRVSVASSIDCAPSDSRVTPAADQRRRVASLVRPGVGLDGDLRARRQPEPRPDMGDQRRQRLRPAASTACRRRGRASRAAAAPPERRVERVGAQVELDVDGRQERLDPAPRPAGRRPGEDDEVAVRAERDAERDVDVQADGRGSGAAPPSRSPFARRRVATADDPPAVGRSVALVDLLDLAAARLESGRCGRCVRKTAKRVMAWPRKAAAIPPVSTVSQPPMSPMPERQDEQVAVALRAPRAASSACRRASG